MPSGSGSERRRRRSGMSFIVGPRSLRRGVVRCGTLVASFGSWRSSRRLSCRRWSPWLRRRSIHLNPERPLDLIPSPAKLRQGPAQGPRDIANLALEGRLRGRGSAVAHHGWRRVLPTVFLGGDGTRRGTGRPRPSAIVRRLFIEGPFDRPLDLVLGLAELPQPTPDRAPQRGEALRPDHDQGDDQDDQEFLRTDVQHLKPAFQGADPGRGALA